MPTDSAHTTAVPRGAAGADAPGSGERRYRAFISYSHADTRWANWLMRKLEGYRVPQRFHGRAAPVGEVGPRLAPIFRDRDELPTTSDLGETIRAALRESATLIVICSPNSAKSRWVLEEIKAFKRLHGERRVFAFIIAGEPKHEGAADDCFSPALRRELGADGELSGPPAEVVAADARPHGDGKGTAFLRLVSGLLGVCFDELRQRELQRRNRRLTLIAAASVAGMMLTLGLAFAAWRARGEALVARNEAVLARNDAQRRQDSAEDVLAFMLGDFRDDLKKVGQLPLLEKVGNKAQAYFETADPRDLTDTALNRQAKALSQIGEVKLLQKDVRYAEAEKAFTAAYQRAAALVARHPSDGDMLFERAQAEYWIGRTHYRRGDMAQAATWLGRYRESANALVALDPTKLTWRDELVMGYHNLAVLEFERGNYRAAQSAFLDKLESLKQLAAIEPTDMQRRYRITDTHSWLGNVAARSGDLAEALRRFAAEREGLEELVRIDPKTAQWSYKLSDSVGWEAEAMAITGNIASAKASLERGIALGGALLKRDPSNRRWQVSRLILQLKRALIDADRETQHAEQVVSEVLPELEKIMATESGDLTSAIRLMTAWRLKSTFLLRSDPGEAVEAAARAVAIGEPFIRGAKSNFRGVGEFALTCVQAGRAAAANGQSDQATTFFQRALDVLGSETEKSSDWCLLDPAARALAYLGRTEQSRSVVERLNRMGYVPLDAWPP